MIWLTSIGPPHAGDREILIWGYAGPSRPKKKALAIQAQIAIDSERAGGGGGGGDSSWGGALAPELFDRLAAAWLAEQEVPITSSPAFRRLVALGRRVVPHAVLAYCRHPDGWWHELLFEVVTGRRSSSSVCNNEALLGE
ncbi:hypothetical protein B0T24DRAFT_598049 [Lasiosphaeria ovina]|uniref:Uncharacterized protein n=1 Tax=Lasiosphaeria ovina TaxID=92902 RepID=A0AAE0JXT6_9PEZI|nr:hypothetical protein B0T24DRAFT_598049 [Lasiosphaeria ovina]